MDWLVTRVGRVAISYWDYYDIPRVFVTIWHGKLFLFDCSFDEEREDYPDHFLVYELPATHAEHLAERSWIGLAKKGTHVGRIAVKDVQFPFRHGAPTVGIGPIPIPEQRIGSIIILTGCVDDEVFKKLKLD